MCRSNTKEGQVEAGRERVRVSIITQSDWHHASTPENSARPRGCECGEDGLAKEGVWPPELLMVPAAAVTSTNQQEQDSDWW